MRNYDTQMSHRWGITKGVSLMICGSPLEIPAEMIESKVMWQENATTTCKYWSSCQQLRFNVIFSLLQYFCHSQRVTPYARNFYRTFRNVSWTSFSRTSFVFWRQLSSTWQLAWHHGPLTRYVKMQVAHAPRMSGTFFATTDIKGNR